MATYHHFATDGKITKVESERKELDDFKLKELNKCYKRHYRGELHLIFISPEIFILAHCENDFPEDFAKSDLPVNRALQIYFPNSNIKGDVILVKFLVDENGDSDDSLFQGEWSLDELKLYKAVDSQFGHLVDFVKVGEDEED
ncbi:MAG: hypothetical protein Solivirus1_32 [Solivirus sp.]|uniref:Uncharacterized protein n=1 Tax=Solivirus sp. TaxID=2487772 RepID=A0A3G5AF80_9VIRU|nr:MAG: hypothetical protein Solivirus1_32 [Solivirus sp.]